MKRQAGDVAGPLAIEGVSGGVPIAITGGGSGGTSSDFGAAFPTAGTAAGFKDSGGTLMQPGNLDASGNLKVNVAAGGGGSVTQGTSPWIVAGGGTAGSAATGVVSVQGIASMTPVQVSQATAANLNATVVQGTATNLKTQAENYQGGTAVSSSNPLQVTLANTGANATAIAVSLASAPTTTVNQGTSPWVVGQSTASALNATVVGTGTFATQSVLTTGSAQIGHLEANQSVNVAQINGVTTTMGNGVSGTGVQRVTIASDSTGVVGLNAGTNLIGSVVNFPGTLVSGTITSAMTGTTSTSLVSGTSSNYLYITSVTISNASTTVSTDILLQDGSGGTTLYVIPCPAATVATTGGGGATVTFPVPLKVPTSGNALYCQNVTTGSSTKASACGFRSTVSY